MNDFLLLLFAPIFALLGQLSQPSFPSNAVDYRPYQSAVRQLPLGPKTPAYAVCDMMESFTGVPSRLNAEALKFHEREHEGSGAFVTLYQYMLERKGLLRADSMMDTMQHASYTHYYCPEGSVLSIADAAKINSPSKIVSLLNEGIKGIVVTYEYCPKDWLKGKWQLGAAKEKHRPKAFHTVLIVGYQDSSFIFKNSWGMGWGEGGYGRMTFDYHYRHARQGLLAYLGEARAPETAQVAKIAIKVLPEMLEGQPHVQISLVAVGPGRLPVPNELSFRIDDGTDSQIYHKVLLSALAQSTGYPISLPYPAGLDAFDLQMKWQQPGGDVQTATFRALHWQNGEYLVPIN